MPRETRVDAIFRGLKSNRVIAIVVAFGVVTIALASFTDAATRLVAAARVLLTPDPLRGMPTRVDFQEWSSEFARARGTKPGMASVPKATEPSFDRANNVAHRTYSGILHALRAGCVAYRKEVAPNLSLDLPPLPASIFAADAADYRGGVTFSRYCSWSVHLDSPQEGEDHAGPTFRIEFMDGDGHVRSGTGIGNLQIWHDFASGNVQIRAVGVVASILHDVPRTVAAQEFRRTAAHVARSLIEHQLRTCRVTDS